MLLWVKNGVNQWVPKTKTPIEQFVERADEIRRRPLTDEDIKKINQLSIEIEQEENQIEPPSDREIADKPRSADLIAFLANNSLTDRQKGVQQRGIGKNHLH